MGNGWWNKIRDEAIARPNLLLNLWFPSLFCITMSTNTKKIHPLCNNCLATDKQFSLCFPSWQPRANFPGVVTKPVSSHSQCWGLLCEPKERFDSVFYIKFNIHNWPEFIAKNVWNETRTISKTWKIYIQLEVDQDDLFVQQCWEYVLENIAVQFILLLEVNLSHHAWNSEWTFPEFKRKPLDLTREL